MELLYIATFFVALVTGVLSGMASVGGAQIIAPWWLVIGLTPAQAAASTAFMDAWRVMGSIYAMRRGGVAFAKQITIALAIIAGTAALLSTFVLPHITTEGLKYPVAILTLLTLPMLFSKRKIFMAGERSRRSTTIGYLVIGALFLAGSFLFGTLSVLIAALIPVFFGTSTLETAAIRRVVGLVQIAIVCVLMFNFIVWPYTIAGLLGGTIGSYFGTKFVVKKGEIFAKYALAVGATISAIALLFS